jgi:mRNA-degrading endonuclease YafQ of YafQ-DinJ toxin-antitoxin module
MYQFKLNYLQNFLTSSRKIFKKNNQLEEKTDNALDLLKKDPFYPSLKSHKVTYINGKRTFSSSVTGNIRIIWNYSEKEIRVIDILDIGGHEGKNKIYK